MVRPRDAQGLIVTGGDGDCVAEIDRFADSFLRRGQGLDAILPVADAAPHCVMAQAYAAAYHLLADTRAGLSASKQYLDRASAHLWRAEEREGLLVTALKALADECPRTADAAFSALGRVAPQDLASAYLAHLHFLNFGEFDRMADLARHIVAANPNNPFALGMASFALEQQGDLKAAEKAGLAACARDPRQPWAHHALGHVYASMGRVEQGVLIMSEYSPTWRGCGSSMYTHNWWHLMLLELASGETGRVLAAYDRHIAGEVKKSLSSYVNAVSMLARLELKGVDVGDRWQILADEAAAHQNDHVLTFVDLHHALAFSRAGRQDALAALTAGVEAQAAKAGPEQRVMWRQAGIPLVRALAAYGCGAWYDAAPLFTAGLPFLAAVGGSSAQRALFQMIAARVGAA